MLEMEKKEQESLEKAKRYAAQKKELLKRKKAEESKKRTHRLCQIGGAVESVLGCVSEEAHGIIFLRVGISWLRSDRTFGGFLGSRLFNLPQFLLQLLHFLYPSNHDLH